MEHGRWDLGKGLVSWGEYGEGPGARESFDQTSRLDGLQQSGEMVPDDNTWDVAERWDHDTIDDVDYSIGGVLVGENDR